MCGTGFHQTALQHAIRKPAISSIASNGPCLGRQVSGAEIPKAAIRTINKAMTARAVDVFRCRMLWWIPKLAIGVAKPTDWLSPSVSLFELRATQPLRRLIRNSAPAHPRWSFGSVSQDQIVKASHRFSSEMPFSIVKVSTNTRSAKSEYSLTPALEQLASHYRPTEFCDSRF